MTPGVRDQAVDTLARAGKAAGRAFPSANAGGELTDGAAEALQKLAASLP